MPRTDQQVPETEFFFFFLHKRLSDLSLSPSLPRKRGADVESRNGYTVNGASVLFFYQRRIPSSLANKVWIIIIIFNIHQICPYADKCRFHLLFIFFYIYSILKYMRLPLNQTPWGQCRWSKSLGQRVPALKFQLTLKQD